MAAAVEYEILQMYLRGAEIPSRMLHSHLRALEVNRRREKLTRFELASPVTGRGTHDLGRSPTLIVRSRNAEFIRVLRRELNSEDVLSDLRIVDGEASVFVVPESSGRAFAILSEVQPRFITNWRGKKNSKPRTWLRIFQVILFVACLTCALVQPAWSLNVVAVLGSWIVLRLIGGHLHRRKKWEGVNSFTVQEMLFGSTLIAIALMLWRFAAA